ncbi:MAG: hypothetical protein JWP97_2603 [Labilithrix sp.]|nr:hypothetical protein [Labilithrix sp.]
MPHGAGGTGAAGTLPLATDHDGALARLVGGTVTGLSGTVTLRLAPAGEEIVVASSGHFAFVTAIATGTELTVTVAAQPASQVCAVEQPTVVVGTSDVTDVSVTCVPTFVVGGTVTGASGSLTLANGDGPAVTVAGDGAFTFPARLAGGTALDVHVVTAPAGQGCAVVAHARGTVTADVADVGVRCFAPYATCKALHAALPEIPSGVYPIAPAGAAFDAYCDMVRDGGGWTRVVNLRPDTSYQADQVDAFGDVSLGNTSAKLDDATINAMSTLGYFRFDCGSYDGFLRSGTGAWSSLRSNGLAWSSDPARTGDFTCDATRDNYGFGAADGACGGGLAYVAYEIGSEGGGCYSEADGWYQLGHLWVK